MLIISCVILLIVFLIGIYIEYKKRTPFLAFYLGLFIVAIYPSIINSFSIYQNNYPDSIYIEANLFSALYLINLLFFRYLLTNLLKTLNIWKKKAFNTPYSDFTYLTIFFILSLSACFICFIFGLKLFSFSKMLNLNWWDLVQSNSKLVIIATYLSYISCGILLSSIYSKNKSIKRLGFVLTVIFLIFSTFVLKTRSYVLMFLMPVILDMLYTKKGVQLIKPVIFIFFVSFLFILARAVRHSYDLNSFLDGNFIESMSSASEGTETTFIDAFYYFIAINNNFDGFEENITLRRILFFWLPYFKPNEFSYIMYAAYFHSYPNLNLSMHPTVFGDAYANAWWSGAFLYSLFLATYISSLEKILLLFGKSQQLAKLIIFSIISITSLIFARGAIYNAFMYSFIPIMFLLFHIFIFNQLIKK